MLRWKSPTGADLLRLKYSTGAGLLVLKHSTGAGLLGLKHSTGAVVLSLLLSAAPASSAASASTSARSISVPAPVVQKPTSSRFQVGDAVVTSISDGSVPLDTHALLTGASETEIDDLLERNFQTNPIEASINVFLVELSGKKILVDTGSGQLFGPGKGGRLQDVLRALGVDNNDVTDILITHMHTDHSGGLVIDGKIMFPRAVVHVGKPDVDFFFDSSNAEKTNYARKYFDEAEKCVRPYEKSGQLKPFADGEEVVPGITASIHPGHTPGSSFYTLKSAGQKMVFLGDVIHVPGVQFVRPDITIKFDLDSKKAAQVRAETFSNFEQGRTLFSAPHLPFPGVGHIAKDGTGYRFYPIVFGDRKSD